MLSHFFNYKLDVVLTLTEAEVHENNEGSYVNFTLDPESYSHVMIHDLTCSLLNKGHGLDLGVDCRVYHIRGGGTQVAYDKINHVQHTRDLESDSHVTILVSCLVSSNTNSMSFSP